MTAVERPRGRLIAWVLSGVLLTAWLGVAEPSTAQASACQGGIPSDFNGDGVRDVAIADPEATVAGAAEAGVVHVVYGGGAGTALLSQEPNDVPGVPENGDRYGGALTVADLNEDGCSDLVVGMPYEDIGTQADAGAVHVVHGAPAGLNTGPGVTEYVQGSGAGSVGNLTAERGDWLGFAVAAGNTAAGDPYLVIGAPGEDIGDVVDSGTAHYLRGSVNVAIYQGEHGVPNPAERDDRFGYSLAASPRHLAIGRPGEAAGNGVFTGNVVIFGHTLNGQGIPTPLVGVDQSTPGINGAAEIGDRFGASITMVPYRPSGASSPTDSVLAVGIPAEDTYTGEDAGRVVTMRVSGSGVVTQLTDVHQSVAGVDGIGRDGDYFGQHITAVNTDLESTGTAETMKLVVGIPGKDKGVSADSGSLQVVPLIGEPGADDVLVGPGIAGLPGQAGPHEYLGTAVWATPERLHVGMPYGSGPHMEVHAVPWSNITDDTGEPVTTWQPGQGGLPTGGKAFGAAIR